MRWRKANPDVPPRPTPGMAAGIDPEKYPNLAAQRERDRQEHVKRAREMGATRKQASKHADEDMAEGEDE